MWAQQQVGMYVTLICVCVCLFAGSRRTAVCGVEGRRVADKNKQQYVNKAEGLSFHFIKAKWRRSAVATGWSFTRSGKSSNLPCWFYCFVGREKLEKKKAFMIAAMNRWVCVFCGRIYRPFYAYRLVCYDLNIGASPGRHYTTHTITRLLFAAPPLLQAWAEEDRWFNLKNILVDRANKLSCLVEPSWSYIFLCCESRIFLSVLLRPQKESKQVSLLEH